VPGTIGVSGPSGPSGPTGTSGGSGKTSNVAGPTGNVGATGPTGSPGSAGVPGPLGTPNTPIATDLPAAADAVGCIVSILGIAGGTGPNGNPQPGDTITVHYAVNAGPAGPLGVGKGLPIPLKELDYGEIILSGPAEENIKYQSVIPLQTDLLAKSTDSNGTYFYTFSVPIPQVYATPPNVNVSFGLPAGSLAGTPLIPGTYTVGMWVAKSYNFGSQPFLDAGTGTFDFLLGSATQLNPRDVVDFFTCSHCHTNLEFHPVTVKGTTYTKRMNDAKYCNLCHVVGAQDANPNTPGELIQFGVMIMRMHNGQFLPSVSGISRDLNGNALFQQTQPLQFVDALGGVHDYSQFPSPVAGVDLTPTFPHVIGYSQNPLPPTAPTFLGMTVADPFITGPPLSPNTGLNPTANEQRAYTMKLTGLVQCIDCHGAAALPPFIPNVPSTDPGPSARDPTQGDVTFKPQLRYCAACHDDWIPTRPYIQNTVVGMPPTQDDTTCKLCHPPTGQGSITGSASMFQAHVHPLLNTPQLNNAPGGPPGATGGDGPENPGINITLAPPTFLNATTTDANGNAATLDPVAATAGSNAIAGDQVQITFTLTNNDGSNFDPRTGFNPTWGTTTPLTRLPVLVSGPTNNEHVLLPGPDPVPGLADTPGGEQPIPLGTTALARSILGQADAAAATANFGVVGAPLVQYKTFVPQSFTLVTLGTINTTPQTFNTPSPLWDNLGATTQVFDAAPPTGVTGTLAADTIPQSQFVLVNSGPSFTKGQFVCVENGAATVEYFKIVFVDTANGDTRLWFGNPIVNTHLSGAFVQVAAAPTSLTGATTPSVAITQASNGTPGVGTGTPASITVTGATAGHVILASFTTNFRIPAAYPSPLNGGDPTDRGLLGTSVGSWFGRPLVNGTYMIAMYGNTTVSHTRFRQPGDTRPADELNTYSDCSPPARQDFVVGPATVPSTPYGFISSGNNCQQCHIDLRFHGGLRRGFDTCIMCHGSIGFQDSPVYVTKQATATTPGVTPNFRVMLHKIHRGSSQYFASTYEVLSNSFGRPPGFVANQWPNVTFPAMPFGVKQCQKCHGATNRAWVMPSGRDYPGDPAGTARVWTYVCTSCHDAPSVTAHIAVMSPLTAGPELCPLCHTQGLAFGVDVVHKVR
jgi:hypothetical protein